MFDMHVDECRPNSACNPVRKFNIWPTVDNGINLLYYETEPGYYDGDYDGEDFKPVAGMGLPLPYAVEAPNVGYRKEYPFMSRLQPMELPKIFGATPEDNKFWLDKVFGFEKLTDMCRRNMQEMVPPPLINPAMRVATGAAGGDAIDSTRVGVKLAANSAELVHTPEYMTLTRADAALKMNDCPSKCQEYAQDNVVGKATLCQDALDARTVADDKTSKCGKSVLSGSDMLSSGYDFENDFPCNCKQTTYTPTAVKFEILGTNDKFVIRDLPGPQTKLSEVMAEFKGSVKRYEAGTTNKLGDMDWTHNASTLYLPVQTLYINMYVHVHVCIGMYALKYMCIHADTQKNGCTDTQTHRHSDAQTHRHTDT